MRIAYPASGIQGEDRTMLSSDFTDSGLIGIVDTTTEQIEVFDKDGLSSGLIDWLSEQNINAIISPELEVMALKVFREKGLDVYKAESSMLALNVELLLNMCLPNFSVSEMYEEGASSCSSNCSSCSSTSCN